MEAVIGLALLGTYAVGALVRARSTAYQIMCDNEITRFKGVQLEPRLYSRSDLRTLMRTQAPAKGTRRMEQFLGNQDIPDDYEKLIRDALLWPVGLTKDVAAWIVLSKLPKTPGQLKRDLKESQDRVRELEAAREKEWRDKLREAGIDD